MLSDQELISLVIGEPSWEDVIVKIVAEEGMDPWSLDLVKLADAFSVWLQHADALDLRLPARFILIAAILLRMKSDILSQHRQKILIPEPESGKDDELLRTLANIPPLQPPLKRTPMGNVTMEELISALHKAFEVSERREERKQRIRQRAVEAVPATDQDISERISNLLTAINTAITELEKDVAFSKLLAKWERHEIVRALMPLLHLSQDGQVTLKQPELFQEIFVERRKSGKVEQAGTA
jgi:segregation and condensation protein A